MKITWYGTASILIETEKTALMFDPFIKYLPKGRESEEVSKRREEAFKKQSNVFITHGHFDHVSSLCDLYKNTESALYLTKTPIKTLKRKRFPLDKTYEIAAGDEITIGDVTVRVLKGKHVRFIWGDIIKGVIKGNIRDLPRACKLTKDYICYPERGEIVFYELEAEGKLVQLMGSAGLCEGEHYKRNADLLILPHQGRKDIDDINAAIVETLSPKRVLLDHYDDSFPPFSTDVPVKAFCETMSKKIRTDALVEFETVEI